MRQDKKKKPDMLEKEPKEKLLKLKRKLLPDARDLRSVLRIRKMLLLPQRKLLQKLKKRLLQRRKLKLLA